MNILTINITVPAKYRDFDIAVRSNSVNCIEKAVSVPFNLAIAYSSDFAEPVVRLHGNTRRIGPVTEGKIRLAVRQGLAITRHLCPTIGRG